MSSPIDTDLERRAFAAYFRTEQAPQQPSVAEVQHHQGRTYVVLSNRYDTLAVYRVRAYDGKLRRLRRWPAELDQ